MGAGEAIITREAGCVAIVGEGAERAPATRSRSSRSSRSPPSARATPSSPATSPPAARALAARVPRLRRRLRGRVDPALRRRHARPARGRAPARPGRGRRSHASPRRLSASRWSTERLGSFDRHHPSLARRVQYGSRDRTGKEGRRAYGFDDIAIVPSRRTRDPDDIDITWNLGPYRFELPLLASAMDGVVSPEDRRADQQARRPRRAQPRGDLVPLRGRRRAARADRGGAARTGDPAHAGDLLRAGQAGADRPADRGDQGPGRRRLRLADAAAGGRALRGRARGGPRHPRHPGHRDLGRARLDDERAAQPQGVHRRGRRCRASSAAAPPTRPACT